MEDYNKVKTNSDGTIVQRTEEEYAELIARRSAHVIDVMRQRGTPQSELLRIQVASDFAKEAHKNQRRKTGAPYIVHPIAVATIAAEELKLDVNSVICAFLHDVVEDTDYTIEDIRERFGDDVAFLVDVVTKKKRDQYHMSKQVDNYKQLLDSLHYDIRALMVKIADRLHNMRTLSSMRPDKQMKIAGETDYFYAPLANRLGLFNVKTDLENLSFKYRCPGEFADLEHALEQDVKDNEARLKVFCDNITDFLNFHGICAKVEVYYRRPYSIYRRMKAQDKDFKHIDNRYYIRITYTYCSENLSEKRTCLKIYSLLTDMYKEKPQSFVNQIDQQKENSYQALKVMLLSEEGVWEDVQICSERMVEASKIGCMAERDESNVGEWMDRFKKVLEEIAQQSQEGSFLEGVAASLYYDDVMVFTPNGQAVVLPKGSTAIDFAFELHTDIGMHAKYAHINGKLSSVKTVLKQGDCIDIGLDDKVMAHYDWLDSTSTYKAKRALRHLHEHSLQDEFLRCPVCHPIPGGEIIGFKTPEGKIMIHRRSCPEAIALSSKRGDTIVAVDFHEEPDKVFPIGVVIRGVDRYHLLMDIVETITTHLKLNIESIHSTTVDNIAECTITFFVHGVSELVTSLKSIYKVEGVDEVRQAHSLKQH